MDNTPRQVAGIVQFYYRFKDFSKRLLSQEYRNFRTYEYPVISADNETDLARLKRIRDLDISKHGYIGDDLKTQLDQARYKNQLISKDAEIAQVGRIEVLDKKARIQEITIGQNTKTGKPMISTSKTNNIPIWKSYKPQDLHQKISTLYPLNSKSLTLRHRSFPYDLARLNTSQQKEALAHYKAVLNHTYNANPKMASALQRITPDSFRLGKYNVDKPVILPHLGNKKYIIVNATDSYVTLRPYLEPESGKNLKLYSRKGFIEALSDSRIKTLGQSPRGVHVGIRDNALFVRLANDQPVDTSIKNKWVPMNEFLSSKNYPSVLRYDVSHNIIEHKNFLNHLSTQQFVFQGKSYRVMEHYGSKEKYIALLEIGKKEMNLKNSMPLEKYSLKKPGIANAYNESVKSQTINTSRRSTAIKL